MTKILKFPLLYLLLYPLLQINLDAYGSYSDFQLVGHGNVTSDMCGRWLGFKGCIRADLHDHVSLSGENFKGKVFVVFSFFLLIGFALSALACCKILKADVFLYKRV